jgi:hypothetical protein
VVTDALRIDAVIDIHGPRQLLRAFRKKMLKSFAEDAPDGTLKEQTGSEALTFDFSSTSGVPFPSLVALSTQYPDCVVTIKWNKASASGETTLQNGQVKEASREAALGGRTPQLIELTPDRTLRLGLALDIGREGILGYCANADAETWFKLAGNRDARTLLTVGGDGTAWDECWRDDACAAVNPPQAFSTTERHALEQLADAFRAEWLWYAHAPSEQTIVERQRYAAAGRPVQAINVKSIKLAEHAGSVISSLAPGQAWIAECLRNTWGQTSSA